MLAGEEEEDDIIASVNGTVTITVVSTILLLVLVLFTSVYFLSTTSLLCSCSSPSLPLTPPFSLVLVDILLTESWDPLEVYSL